MTAKSRRRNERGASAIEMAIVAPSFLLFIFVIIEVALWMHARDVAMAAAREGVAELRVVDPEDSPRTWERAVEQSAEQSARDLGDVQNPEADAEYDQDTERVTVTVSGGVIDLIPGWDITVSGTASGSIEDFQPDLGKP
jgi:Flp pilus assembly protein TadG